MSIFTILAIVMITMRIGYSCLKKKQGLDYSKVKRSIVHKMLTAQEMQEVSKRFNSQVIIYREALNPVNDEFLAVFYGPFPHPATAEMQYEPTLYQVVWQASLETKPPRAKRAYLFTESNDVQRIMVWLPPNAEEAKKLVKDTWKIDLDIPSFSN